MSDLFVSIGILGAFMSLTLAYAVRLKPSKALRRGAGRAIVTMPFRAMVTELLRPLTSLVAACRVTPNKLKISSLIPAAGAGVSLAIGHFGWGAFLATFAVLVDTVKGTLAHETDLSVPLVDVVDAGVDRYREAFPFIGLALYYRSDLPVLLLVFAALGGSLMMNYAAAKADAMGAPSSRGGRQTAERAQYLLTGAVLTPVVGAAFPSISILGRSELPILISLAIVAVVSNAFAVHQLVKLAARLRARKAAENRRASAPEGETVVAAKASLPVTALEGGWEPH